MEANPLQNNEPGSTSGSSAQNSQRQSILGQTFYRILQKVMASATENGNSGA